MSEIQTREPGTFLDSKNKVWKLELNYGMIIDLKEKHQIDIDSINSDTKSFAELMHANPKKLVEMFYVICEEQILQTEVKYIENGETKTRIMNPTDFGRIFTADTLNNAVQALFESVILFYRRTSAGKVLAENVPAIFREVENEIQRRTREKIPTLLADLPKSLKNIAES